MELVLEGSLTQHPADGPSRLRRVPEAENLFSEPIDMIKVPRDVFSSFD